MRRAILCKNILTIIPLKRFQEAPQLSAQRPRQPFHPDRKLSRFDKGVDIWRESGCGIVTQKFPHHHVLVGVALRKDIARSISSLPLAILISHQRLSPVQTKPYPVQSRDCCAAWELRRFFSLDVIPSPSSCSIQIDLPLRPHQSCSFHMFHVAWLFVKQLLKDWCYLITLRSFFSSRRCFKDSRKLFTWRLPTWKMKSLSFHPLSAGCFYLSPALFSRPLVCFFDRHFFSPPSNRIDVRWWQGRAWELQKRKSLFRKGYLAVKCWQSFHRQSFQLVSVVKLDSVALVLFIVCMADNRRQDSPSSFYCCYRYYLQLIKRVVKISIRILTHEVIR